MRSGCEGEEGTSDQEAGLGGFEPALTFRSPLQLCQCDPLVSHTTTLTVSTITPPVHLRHLATSTVAPGTVTHRVCTVQLVALFHPHLLPRAVAVMSCSVSVRIASMFVSVVLLLSLCLCCPARTAAHTAAPPTGGACNASIGGLPTKSNSLFAIWSDNSSHIPR